VTKEVAAKLKEEIDELVAIGEQIAHAASCSDSSLGQDYIIKTSMWVGRIGQIIRRLYGSASQHLVNYEKTLSGRDFYIMHSNYYGHIGVMAGIIKAIQHEFERGLVSDFRRILQADIFADFLEMGEYLLNEGYKDAAAVIIGSVLEDALRKLAQANGISTVSNTGKSLTLEPLNIECAKTGVYDKLIQKQITTWGELRNKAAHGHYNAYDKDQVQMMLLFVQKFCSEHLGT